MREAALSLQLLVVDPDRRLLDVYCAYFSHFGLRASCTTAGERAERRYIEQGFDVVMLEPHLPDDGEISLLRTIAISTGRRPLPVVIVSRHSHYQLEFPVYAYFVKPAAMPELLESIVNAAKP